MNAQTERSPWEIAAIAGLIAMALGPILTMLLDGRLATFGLIFVAIPLALLGLVLTRNRWLILVAVIVSALYFLGAIRAAPVQYRLAHPEATGYFVVALLEVLGSAVSTVSGVGRLVQGLAPGQPRGGEPQMG
jgi:hypothetical protein